MVHKRVTMHKTGCQIIDRNNNKNLTEFLCKEGQLLVPMVWLNAQTEMAADELIEATGRVTIEAVLTLSTHESARLPNMPAKRPARSPGMASGRPRFFCLSVSFGLKAQPQCSYYRQPIRENRLRRRDREYDATRKSQAANAIWWRIRLVW